MIPWSPAPALELGPLRIEPFLLLTLLGVLVGACASMERARAWKLDAARHGRLVAAVLIAGFLGAHLVAIAVYRPERLRSDPWVLLRFWDGLSAFGGFLAASLAAAYVLRAGGRSRDGLRHLDALAWALPYGWVLGRLGCTLALDHPGVRTTSPLGFAVRPGVAYHNLGFYEMLVAIALAAVFWPLRAGRTRPGVLVAAVAITLSVFRLGTDHLRLLDRRYAGLTPGHWAAALFLTVGLALAVSVARRDDLRPAGRIDPREIST